MSDDNPKTRIYDVEPPQTGEAWFRWQNRQIMHRVYCIQCHTAVREEEYKWKYAAAGGCMEGPFCSEECHWEWFLSG